MVVSPPSTMDSEGDHCVVRNVDQGILNGLVGGSLTSFGKVLQALKLIVHAYQDTDQSEGRDVLWPVILLLADAQTNRLVANGEHHLLE